MRYSGDARLLSEYTPKRIIRLLEEKHRLALETWQRRGRRLVFDTGPVAREAARRFGRLQDMDLSAPAGQAAYRAVVESLPGLVTLLHLHSYRRGRLLNEIMALEGPGGIGKTSYVYWLAKMVGGVVSHTVDELMSELLGLARDGWWVPLLVGDDIATDISKYWFMDKREREKFKGLFKAIEYAKDWAGLILFTARSFEGIARRFRELSTYKGTMERVAVGDGIVDVITWYRGSDPYYVDVLWPGLEMPSDEWSQMMNTRRRKAVELLSEYFVTGGEEGDGQ